MKDEFTRELKNAFIADIKRKEMDYRIFDNVIMLAFEPAEHIGIDHSVIMSVAFLREEIMVRILNIATATSRSGALALLNMKNEERLYGKYCLCDNGEIQYMSLKWFPNSKNDTSCIYDLIIKCLKEFAEDEEEIVNCGSCR